jgi:excisionase family DNA binding protein
VPVGDPDLEREGDALPNDLAGRLSLRIDEVAATTGLSASLVRTLVRDGELPVVRVRSVPLVRTADLLAFLESRVSVPEAVAERIANELEASLAGRRV